ncbi:MAG: tRNA 2-thiouridine(34) synthase MnmA [gamma proteobacterium symbiont of Bathyaustriella thionipta]|nr:tRNA 2-thiouridine(34) synthase MnmA [gamma proteobacterium symbiont of Bathyaustriella thionipta]
MNSIPSSEKVIVGLSGGVDSSVAALLLLEKGYQVEGLFMKNWEEDDSGEYCAAAEDLADAQAVCRHLGIRLRSVNFSSEYWDRVFRHFLQEYRAGRTPNPDVLCNKEIKFRAFLEHARDLGADYIATGHYARRVDKDEGALLYLSADENKDQTYFLYLLTRAQLATSLFPLADFSKQQVREMARQAGLPVAEKKDSTGICFIGERKFRDFLQQYLPANPGDIVTTEGRIIAQHHGLMFYTLGQGKGLGIGGVNGAQQSRWFVVDKDLAANRLIVAQDHQHPLLMKKQLSGQALHWIARAPAEDEALLARIRHRQPLQACRIRKLEKDRIQVEFEQPQRAITAGQAIVFYQGERCLGGATICS